MRWLLFLIFFCCPVLATAKINVVATGSDLGALAKEIGADDISLEVLAKGSQDLHFLETKPSYMLKLNKADLLVLNGLGLESAWLPTVIQGARNPKIAGGSVGYFDLGVKTTAIEIPQGAVSRANGDVHPEGNPHWTLDPSRMAQASEALGVKLAELDPNHREQFKQRALALKNRLLQKDQDWRKRLAATQIKKVVTYHRTLNYFLQHFGVEASEYLEPKPGIPPSAQHTLQVISTIKTQKIPLVLVEHYYDDKSAERVAKEIKGLRVVRVAAATEGLPGVKSLDDLYERLVRAFEGAAP